MPDKRRQMLKGNTQHTHNTTHTQHTHTTMNACQLNRLGILSNRLFHASKNDEEEGQNDLQWQ